jgi:isopenicillin N synthase-like dioxygenase
MIDETPPACVRAEAKPELLPAIDIGPLWGSAAHSDSLGGPEQTAAALEAGRQQCVRAIGQACRHQGFFYVVNHGVSPALERELEDVSRAYFALPDQDKREISMARGGLAWRGSFLVGDELTSGVPDQKEGVYYGEEEEEEGDASLRRPLRGKNLFHDNALGESDLREHTMST